MGRIEYLHSGRSRATRSAKVGEGERTEEGLEVQTPDDWMTLRVAASPTEAEGVRSFVLVDPDGTALPAWTPGAHVDVCLDTDLVRQYSLCGAPEDRGSYRIGVLREEAGRGGSRFLHDRVRTGDLLRVRP